MAAGGPDFLGGLGRRVVFSFFYFWACPKIPPDKRPKPPNPRASCSHLVELPVPVICAVNGTLAGGQTWLMEKMRVLLRMLLKKNARPFEHAACACATGVLHHFVLHHDFANQTF